MDPHNNHSTKYNKTELLSITHRIGPKFVISWFALNIIDRNVNETETKVLGL